MGEISPNEIGFSVAETRQKDRQLRNCLSLLNHQIGALWFHMSDQCI
jgi:hypothetical protein